MQSSIPRCFGRTRRTPQTTSADAPAPREIIEEWNVTDDARVPARIIYTEDGETFHTYEIGGIPDPSAKAIKAEFEARSPLYIHD